MAKMIIVALLLLVVSAVVILLLKKNEGLASKFAIALVGAALGIPCWSRYIIKALMQP